MWVEGGRDGSWGEWWVGVAESVKRVKKSLGPGERTVSRETPLLLGDLVRSDPEQQRVSVPYVNMGASGKTTGTPDHFGERRAPLKRRRNMPSQHLGASVLARIASTNQTVAHNSDNPLLIIAAAVACCVVGQEAITAVLDASTQLITVIIVLVYLRAVARPTTDV